MNKEQEIAEKLAAHRAEKVVENKAEKTKTKKFTEEELKTISEIKQIYDNTTLRIGQLHFEEKQLLKDRVELEKMFNNNREKEIKFAQELNDKYGKGTLDIETGIFTPVE
tara:strand:- start:293 stop:622 length:330 start_codon:yes stop_codon:yes gene_type:complete